MPQCRDANSHASTRTAVGAVVRCAGKIKLCIVALIHWHTFDSDACTCTGDWPSNDACINQLQTGYYYCIGNEPALCFDLFEALSTT